MGAVVTGRTDAEYRETLAAGAAARGLQPEEWEKRLASHGVPVGPAPAVRERLDALAEIGVGRFYLQWLDLADLGGLDTTFEVLAG